MALAVSCGALLAPIDTRIAGASGDADIHTIAGTGISGYSGDGGQATAASISRPRSIFSTADGGYLFAEPFGHRVRRVGSDGIITTVAGNGVAGFSGDGGPATQARINFVHAAAPTADGGFLLADTLNNRIRKVGSDGVITTVAGTGVAGFSGDGGPATAAAINNPRGVVALADGGFLIPDTNNHRVRQVSATGTITTVAGSGVQGFTGDGGLATASRLSTPFGVVPMPDGGLLIADLGNQRIRRVLADGNIITVAGTGTAGYTGDGGAAISARLNNPHNLAGQPDGGFLIADAANHRIRRVAPDGSISTVAGDGIPGFSGDGGPATSASLNVPKAVAVTAAGQILIADESNNRIRLVGLAVAPVNVSPPTISGGAVAGQTLTASAGGWSGTGPVISYQWRRCDDTGGGCVDIAGATGTTFAVGSDDVGATLRVSVTATNASGSATAASEATAVVAPPPPSAPVNTAPPVITGVAEEGETLSASSGTWSGTAPTSYAYQWRRCDGGGAGCVDIAGATGSTYVVAAGDVGATLRVAVTATNAVSSSVYSSRVVADSPLSYWRFNEISGPLVDVRGFKDGAYFGGPERGAPSLVPGDGDAATVLNGTSQYVEVPASTAWTPSAFSLELVVRPSALPVNRTIWATQGVFTGWWLATGPTGTLRMSIGTGSSWVMQDSGVVLEPGVRYHLMVTYDGTRSRVYVNGTLRSTGASVTMRPNGGANVMRFGSASRNVGQFWPGTVDEASLYPAVLSDGQVAAHHSASLGPVPATSDATGVVVAPVPPPANVSAPTVSGAAVVGETLTASSGDWSGSPTSYTFQWRRCDDTGGGCVDITGATGTTYAVASDDVGATLRVAVTATNASGSASAESNATGVVVAASAPVNVSAPTVSGAAVVGETLTASSGDWSGSPTSYTFQWRRCDDTGGGCVDITGATGTTYAVASDDVGATLRVAVTATNASGSATAVSAPTDAVS